MDAISRAAIFVTAQPRSTRSEFVHVSIAIDDALNFLQTIAEESAARYGDLSGPVLPAQRGASRAIDIAESLRQEAAA